MFTKTGDREKVAQLTLCRCASRQGEKSLSPLQRGTAAKRQGVSLKSCSISVALFILLLVTIAQAQPSPANVQRVVMSPKFQAAEDYAVKDHDRRLFGALPDDAR